MSARELEIRSKHSLRSLAETEIWNGKGFIEDLRYIKNELFN